MGRMDEERSCESCRDTLPMIVDEEHWHASKGVGVKAPGYTSVQCEQSEPFASDRLVGKSRPLGVISYTDIRRNVSLAQRAT